MGISNAITFYITAKILRVVRRYRNHKNLKFQINARKQHARHSSRVLRQKKKKKLRNVCSISVVIRK
jgi:hypothetical protein